MEPSYGFFDEVFRRSPKIRLTVEDSGNLHGQIDKLHGYYNLMDMSIIPFELQSKLLRESWKEHIVLYTGTYDNNALEGFYQLPTQNRRIALCRFFHNCGCNSRMFHELMIRYCLDNAVDAIILSVSGILGSKSEGCLDTPEIVGGPSWRWKMKNLREFYTLLPELGGWIRTDGRNRLG